MADEKTPPKNSEDAEQSPDRAADSGAPEVEAEIVSTGLDEGARGQESAKAVDGDEDGQAPGASAHTPGERSSAASEVQTGVARSPGMALFVFFMAAAVAVLALFAFNRQPDQKAADTAATAVATEHAPSQAATNVNAPERAAAKIANAPVKPADRDMAPASSKALEDSQAHALATPAPEASPPATADVPQHKLANAVANAKTAIAEAQAERAQRNAVATDNSAEPSLARADAGLADAGLAGPGESAAPEETPQTPVDPRAAILALQAEAEARARDEAAAGEATKAKPVAQKEPAVASAKDSPIAAANADTADETPPNQAPIAGSKIDNAFREETSRLLKEITALREQLRAETDALSAAVTEGRALTEAQSTRITDLRESLEQALAERDERASTEINNLRAQLVKIQNEPPEAAAAADHKAAASLALLSLQRAVDAGAPFLDELGVLADLAPQAPEIAALRANAADGVATLAALKAEFEPAIHRALASERKTAAPNGLFARFSALVSVRPATPQSGADLRAVISRAEGYLAKDNLSAALAEISAIDGAPADVFRDWTDAARARVSATNAIAALNDALLNTLGG